MNAMTHKWKMPGWMLLALCVLAGAAPAQPKPPHVLEYLGQRASRMAAKLPSLPADVATWEKRRDEVRRSLTQALGLPERAPMKAVITASKSVEDLIFEDVLYLWSENAYVAATVVRPKEDKGRLPGIVVPPGWLGSLAPSGSTAGLYSPFVKHMARLGYLVMFIDDPHVNKRAAPYAGLYGVASAAGTQVMGIQVFDTLRGLDYLLARPDVDPGRIGVAGLCQGSEQTWLAAALEERFKYAVPVCGTTTYEDWVRMPFFLNISLSDPSPYVTGILKTTDWHEINACIAPRPVLICSNSGDNWWPEPGFHKVTATLEKVFALYGHPERFKYVLDLRSHDMTPYLPEIAPWIENQVKALAPSNEAPQACAPAQDPDPSMMHYLQKRIESQAAAYPARTATTEGWTEYRKELIEWLRQACDRNSLQPAGDRVADSTVENGIKFERLELSIDGDFTCAARLYQPKAKGAEKKPVLILSHDSAQCMASPELVSGARNLAKMGYWVLTPEHASMNKASQRPLPGGWGIRSLYGAGDTVGLPPLALRVADDLAACRYLASRPEVKGRQLLIAGLGIGGVDACMASLLEPCIAGTAVIGATTFRDWATLAAPAISRFDIIMPYLPSMLTKTDLDYCYAALAPRPLLVVRSGDRKLWPDTDFAHVAATVGAVYRTVGAKKEFRTAEAQNLAHKVKAMDIHDHLALAAMALLSPPAGK
jgi:dienelactone hydrolase